MSYFIPHSGISNLKACSRIQIDHVFSSYFLLTGDTKPFLSWSQKSFPISSNESTSQAGGFPVSAKGCVPLIIFITLEKLLHSFCWLKRFMRSSTKVGRLLFYMCLIDFFHLNECLPRLYPICNACAEVRAHSYGFHSRKSKIPKDPRPTKHETMGCLLMLKAISRIKSNCNNTGIPGKFRWLPLGQTGDTGSNTSGQLPGPRMHGSSQSGQSQQQIRMTPTCTGWRVE